jgi:hypothetical protein
MQSVYSTEHFLCSKLCLRLGLTFRSLKLNLERLVFKVQPDASRLHQLAEDIDRQEFSIPIARTMRLHEIQEVHLIFERGGPAAKIVLLP